MALDAKRSKLKTLGIIGGVGPEATVDYYQSIIYLYRERNKDGSYPRFLINSINLQKGVDFITAKNWDALVKFLTEEIGTLARAGADFGLIAANTPHIVFDEIQGQSAIPLISIVKATCDHAQRMNLHRLALFGTRFTMQADFYQRTFAEKGMETVTPALPEQDYIHDKYMNELVKGIFSPGTRSALLAIVDRMKHEERIDGVILGGTELPLLLRDESHDGTPFLNTTKIHVEAAVIEMLS